MTTKPRPLGGSTFSFMWDQPVLPALRAMQALGLNDFDVILAPGHLWYDELAPAARADLARSLSGEGLRVDSLNLPALDVNLASCVAEVRDFSERLYQETFRLAADLGVRNVVVVPGRVSTLLPPKRADTLGWLRESLERLLRMTEDTGQRLLIELHPLTPVPTTPEMLAFMEGIADPRLLIAYDVANAEFVGETQADALRSAASRLGQIHLSDGTRKAWRHDRVGAGTVDFHAVLATLDELAFAGTAVLEVISPDPIDDLAESMRRLRPG